MRVPVGLSLAAAGGYTDVPSPAGARSIWELRQARRGRRLAPAALPRCSRAAGCSHPRSESQPPPPPRSSERRRALRGAASSVARIAHGYSSFLRPCPAWPGARQPSTQGEVTGSGSRRACGWCGVVAQAAGDALRSGGVDDAEAFVEGVAVLNRDGLGETACGNSEAVEKADAAEQGEAIAMPTPTKPTRAFHLTYSRCSASGGCRRRAMVL